MKKSKKLLRVMLALVMLFGLILAFGTTVSADSATKKTIGIIAITGIDAPAVGQPLDTTATCVAEGVKSVSIWWRNNTDHVDVADGEVAKAGKVYQVNVELLPEDGYLFAGYSSAIATINGNEAPVCGGGVDSLSVYYIFPATTIEISAIKINGVTEPKDGQMGLYYCSSDNSIADGYNIITAFWEDSDNNKMSSGKKFEAGNTYTLVLWLEPLSGYSFVSRKDMTITINGNVADISEVGGYEGTLCAFVDFICPIMIDKVDITGIVEPVDGEKPVETCDGGVGYTVYDVRWWDCTSNYWLKSDAAFVGGQNYEAIVSLIPESTYSFADAAALTGTINGKKAEVSSNGEGKMRYISLEFYCDISIDKVDVSLYPPEADHYPSVPKSKTSNVTVGAYKWYYIDYMESTIPKILPDNTPFVNGKTYQVRIMLYPDSGYAFDNSTDIAINGETAYIVSRSADKITCYINFEVTEDSFVIGDVDMDGIITASDAANTLQKSLNNTFVMNCENYYPTRFMEIADVSGDGVIGADDAACMLQKSLNSSFVFPIVKNS